MTSFSGLGIGLSFVFGCIFLGLVAELYYKLWYKKNSNNINTNTRAIEDHRYSRYIESLSHLICFKKPSSQLEPKILNSTITPYPNPDELADPESGFPRKGFGEEEGLDSELIRIHNLCGPPRFLFTIKEESREDLESDDGRSRGERSRKGSRNMSLSDFLLNIESSNTNTNSPVLTPLASPRVYNINNPLFGGLTEAEVNRAISSPPPKFKFLRDAEEKLKKREREMVNLQSNSNNNNSIITTSKVLPLPQSPLSIGSF